MRIACIRVPFFPVAVERRSDLIPTWQPLVVIDGKTVLAASADVVNIHAGLSARRARAFCPHATFIEANHALYRDVFDAMLTALEGVTPLVEPADLGVAYADVAGFQGQYEDEFALASALMKAVQVSTSLLPSVGIADGKFVAWVAALISPPGDALPTVNDPFRG